MHRRFFRAIFAAQRTNDAEPLVVAPAVIEEPEEIDAEAEAEFIEASVPESTNDSDDDSDDDDFAVEESDEDDDAEPMDVDAGAPSLERRLIDDDDGAAPASHYSTIASHRDLRRCHDGGTARPRSPRARPTSSLRERPGRVRSCSSSPARPHVGRAGPWAPRPSGSERSSSRPSCSSCTVTPTSSSLPRVSFPLLPPAHKELYSIDTHTALAQETSRLDRRLRWRRTSARTGGPRARSA